MRPFKLYTVVEDESIGQELADATTRFAYPNLERVFDALVWRLARDPDCGEKYTGASGVEYRLVKCRSLKSAKNPSILARYRIEAQTETVFVERIVVFPFNPKDAYSAEEYEL